MTFTTIERALRHLQILNKQLENHMREALLSGDLEWATDIAHEDSLRCYHCDQEDAFKYSMDIIRGTLALLNN